MRSPACARSASRRFRFSAAKSSMRTITRPGRRGADGSTVDAGVDEYRGRRFLRRGWNPASSRPRIRCARFAARSASRRAERSGGAPLLRRRERGGPNGSPRRRRAGHSHRSRQRHEVQLGARGESSHRVLPVGPRPGDSWVAENARSMCAPREMRRDSPIDLESAVRSLDKTHPALQRQDTRDAEVRVAGSRTTGRRAIARCREASRWRWRPSRSTVSSALAP